jgi:hypothetical protein
MVIGEVDMGEGYGGYVTQKRNRTVKKANRITSPNGTLVASVLFCNSFSPELKKYEKIFKNQDSPAFFVTT